MTVRVRFAPSPTGYLHVGGARTALFNWLFARRNNGVFILRIEDTDTARSTEEATQSILDGMRWLGLNWDEGPFYQTHNHALHKAAAEALVASGHAYRAYETKEELDAMRAEAEVRKVPFKYNGAHRELTPEQQAAFEAEGRSHVIRFKVPRTGGSVKFTDLVYGEQEKAFDDIEDFSFYRSEGGALYLLSNAVDDAEQRVTHVIRGQDGLANTPKQVLLYQAMGKTVPQFAHLPLILDENRVKISKRIHGDAATVKFYKEKGFLTEAYLNFLALLGWSSGDEREILSLDDMRDAFSFERISHTNAIFNLKGTDERNWIDPKLLWMNSEYLKAMPLDRLVAQVRPFLEEAGLWQDAYANEEAEWFARTVDLLRARYRVLTDFATYGKPYFSDEFEFEAEAVKKNFKDPALRDLLPQLADHLETLEEFTHDSVEAGLRAFAEAKGVKAGLLINGSRTALTGQSVGPSMFELFAVMGKARSVTRLRKALS
ncbi:MAG: glutamate--tRNA ligase [Blastocatellia bacterium]|nr:glutamate--tRNA ligase [Blastocatellia bacterium]